MAFEIRGSTCVITGAGSGMGRQTALLLARGGCNLALAEIDQGRLSAIGKETRALGVSVSEHLIDVADASAVAALPDAVLDAHGRVNLLVNNAGVALMGTFDQMTLEEFEWLFNINFWGVVRMTHAFLPHLRRQKAAHVVNISSLFGLVAPAGQSAYVAAKFGVRGFSESIRQEWKGTNLSLTVVHPGGVKTAIAREARVARGADQELEGPAKKAFEKLLVTSAEKASGQIVGAIARQKKRLRIGADAVLGDILARAMPVHYNDVLDRLQKVTGGEVLAKASRMKPLSPAANTY